MSENHGYNWKRNTVIFLASQAISIFGSSLVQYAITWHITLTTKSGIFTMLAIVFGFVPTFILSPFAGVWADRYDRKKLIILSDGGIALATLILAMLFITGNTSIWLLLGAMAVRGLGAAIQQPCIGAMLPDMVPTEHLTRVNGINQSVRSLIMLISPMVSGALMGFIPLGGIFFIDVATAALAIAVMVCFFHLPVREPKPKPEPGAYFIELKEGFSYIMKFPYLRHFFLGLILLQFCAGPVATLTPLQVARSFGDEVWRLSTIEVVFAAGMLVGGITIATWGGFKNRAITMSVSGMGVGLLTVGLGLPVSFIPYCCIMCLCGIILAMFDAPAVVMLQERVDPAYMGRIFGVMTMLGTSLMPLSMLLFGPLADVVPIEYLLIGTGVVMFGLGFAIRHSKPLMAAGMPVKRAPAEAAVPEHAG